MLRVVVVLSSFYVDLFTYILQGYFTGTEAIIWLPQCQWRNPEDMAKIDQQ